jgi:hypothetical protein
MEAEDHRVGNPYRRADCPHLAELRGVAQAPCAAHVTRQMGSRPDGCNGSALACWSYGMKTNEPRRYTDEHAHVDSESIRLRGA